MSSLENPLLNPIILHRIFLDLPQKDILLAQRVCKTWQRLIQKSQSIQKSLFLLPDYDDIADNEEEIQVNSLLAEHFPDFFKHLLQCNDRVLGPLRNTKWHQFVDPARNEVAVEEREKVNYIYARFDASWRRMVPSRPAPRELQMLVEVNGRFGSSGAFKKLIFKHGANPEGKRPEFLTFGLMYDVVQYFMLPSYEKRLDTHAKVEIMMTAMEQSDDERTLAQRYADGYVPSASDLRWYMLRKYRCALPDQNVAGKGSVVLTLTKVRQCKRGRPTDPGQEYAEDYLRSEASLIGDGKKKIRWDVERDYRVR